MHDGTDNTSKPQSVDGIAMYQKNEREGYAFMSLEAGSIIFSNIWMPLPITQEIIEKVESITMDMIEVEDLLQEIDEHLTAERLQSMCNVRMIKTQTYIILR